jgi:uncharacterized membrane protein YhaH (DUF805 family)
MTFGEAIKSGFQNYVVWKGRATRSEYWWWFLFTQIIILPFSIIYQISIQGAIASGSFDIFNGAYFLLLIVALALFLPSLSVLIRRLHDTDRSGGWYWILLVPIVGSIVILVFMLLESTPGPNRFDS